MPIRSARTRRASRALRRDNARHARAARYAARRFMGVAMPSKRRSSRVRTAGRAGVRAMQLAGSDPSNDLLRAWAALRLALC
ncbi:hypothetical protein WL48_01615 [Burkholderia ubonensis]|nr:hypothetical protein WL48_01615 [Burkholderia ubonensis]